MGSFSFFVLNVSIALEPNFPLSAFYRQHLQGLEWIFENNGACGIWEAGETCRGTEGF